MLFVRLSRGCVVLSRSPSICLWPRSRAVLKVPAHCTKQTRCLTLRPYQEESIQAVLDHLQKGHKRLGISLATGAGKTVIFSQLIGRIPARNEKATRTLILVHRRELVQQAYNHCAKAYPELEVDADMGSLHASGRAPITVASVMSLNRGRLEKYDPATYKLILVDEAHHVVSPTYLTVLRHFGLVPPEDSEALSTDQAKELAEFAKGGRQDGPALVGVSATFSRFDGLSLGHAIDQIVYHKDYIDLIGEKWLSDVRFSTAKSGADLSRVKTQAQGDFSPASLSTAMNTNRTNEAVVQTWLSKAEGRKSTLIFAVDVAHVEGLTQAFLDHGIDARNVTGQTPIYARSSAVEEFRRGKFPVLINCGIFTEGTDIPNIDCVLLARPTKSRNLLVQMIGRGMRLHEGKQDCHVIDMVSALRTGIMSVPTLFGLDPTALLENEDVTKLNERRRQFEASPSTDQTADVRDESLTRNFSRPGSIEFKEYDSVHELLADDSRDAHIRQMSRYNWVQVGPDESSHDRYILTGNDDSYMKITHLGDKSPCYEVSLVRKLPKEALEEKPTRSGWVPYLRPKKIAASDSLSDALHAADTYIGNSTLFTKQIVEWRRPWRQRPATEPQIRLLEKYRGGDESWSPADYTMGRCGDIITRMKFGAKGHYKAIKSHQARSVRKERKSEREKEMRAREKVQVGPLSESLFV